MIKHIYKLITVFLIVNLFASWKIRSCQVDCCRILLENNFNDTDTVAENRIMNKLFRLPEVRASNRFIDSLTHHSHGISMRIVQRPTREKKYYIIDAGYSSEVRFENYYNFYVWPDKMIIKIVDSYTGKLLTLNEWREKR